MRIWFFCCIFALVMLCNDIHKALCETARNYRQICIVADQNLTLDIPFLEGFPCLHLFVSERHKSIEMVAQIWDFLFEHDITRNGLLVAIGGGVLTDVAGFAASTYKRGIDYLNIPTTLLAMVDASSGGKTGFNYHGLKNNIGVFSSPIATLIWPQWLHTLPYRQFLSGYAEMLKTGLLEGNGLWGQLLQYDLDTMDTQAIVPLIEACLASKERIVAADPQEKGLRKVLNLGHTFGHAMEELSLIATDTEEKPDGLLHGYAVLYGLIAELYLSVIKLGCSKEPLQQLSQLMLHQYGRPDCKCSDRERLIRLMRQDKKNEHAGEINCTLIQSVGSPVVNQKITPEEAEEALDYLFSL